nr:HAMP domain-containing sensor histidine kinase [uncultured Flavobacterium sp.]
MIYGYNGAQISRKELLKLIEFLPYPILIWEMADEKEDGLFFNSKFVSQIGYNLEDAPTRQELLRLLYPEELYRTKVLQMWREQLELSKQTDEVGIKLKVQLTCKTGHKKWFEIKVSVIDHLYIAAYVDIDSDVIMQEKLTEINANKDRMLSILGHDLRSPIANLVSISSMAQDAVISQPEFVSMLQFIREESMEVLELLDATFDWARFNFNSMRPRLVPIDFNTLINGVLKMAKRSYESKNITVSVNVLDLGNIESDFEILTIVLRNIISNAVKFTPKNGLITITADASKLIIRDNGVGMNAQKLQEIGSESIFSVRGTENEKGNGIGLKLVSDLIEKINCTLAIESTIEKGTTVTIWFK